MSIPLDRLYHYLEELTSDDIIIYRWSPHGSKKLDDLLVIGEDRVPTDWIEQLTKINMICHDQEPLDYNYYTFELCMDRANKLADLRKTQLPEVSWCYSDEYVTMIARSHLRVVVEPFMNFNDNLLLCHSEKNSEQLEIYEKNGYIGVYYWAHALIAKDWYRYAEHDPLLLPDFNNITQDFLIYSRAWTGTREYRLKMAQLLVDYNLVPNCNTKFNPVDNHIHYTNHKFVNKSLAVARQDLETFFPANTASSNSSADYQNTDYATSGIEVVLETLFDDSRNHLTEKSLRPIACGRPFILVGTAGSLSYLRDYGFKTFSGLIDETYDTIKDPAIRLEKIVKELSRIASLPRDEKLQLWKQLYDIAAYNKARFFSSEFHNNIVEEYVTNVNAGIQQCKSTMHGKWWKIADNPLTDKAKQANAWLDNYVSDLSKDPSQSSPGS